MQRPLIKIPLRPLPMASVCITSGNTVPLAVWNKKTMARKTKRVGSRKTCKGVSALRPDPVTSGVSFPTPKIKLGLLASGFVVVDAPPPVPTELEEDGGTYKS